MPLTGLPRILEQLLNNLLQENIVSSFKVDSNTQKTTVILRLSSLHEDAMAADTASTTHSTYRRKSQAQMNRDRRRAENHRSAEFMNNEQNNVNNLQASDFIDSSSRVDPPPPPPPPNNNVSTCVTPNCVQHVSDVNKPPSHTEEVATARAMHDTTASPVQAAKTVTQQVKVHEPPKQQPAAASDDTRDNVGLHPDNEYRRRLRSASRNVGHITTRPSTSQMFNSEMQVFDYQLSTIAHMQDETTRRIQESLQSGFQRLNDGINARTSASTLSNARQAKFLSDQRRLFDE